MAIPYLVRKKADLTSGERKEKWYAVAKKLQRRGGVGIEELAAIMAQRSHLPQGMILGVLSELGDTVEYLLGQGHSVTISNLGSFQTAVSSHGFETPEQVMPGKVELTRVYFIADRKLTSRLKQVPRWRVPFATYFPAEQITEAMRRSDKGLKAEEK